MRPDLLKLCGAKGNRTLGLLDANETTWAFVDVERVGLVDNSLARRLAASAWRVHFDALLQTDCGRYAPYSSRK